MRITVVGGGGYTGTSLVPALQDHGHDVTVVDLMWFGQHLPEGTRVIRQDVMELKEEDLRGAEQVIFLAGLSNDPMAEYSPSKNFISNSAAPAYLGYIAKRAGVRRIVYASTCSVYGYTKNEMSSEDSPVRPIYPYGMSKLQGEQSLLQLADDTFSVISLRKGTLSGHSPRMRFDLVVNAMFRSAVLTSEVVVNNPAIWRPIISVRDSVSAYLRAIEADAAISGIFNVISGNHTIGQVGETVKSDMERLLNRRIKLTIKSIPDLRNYKVHHNKAAEQLGFQPRFSLSDIVTELFGHVKEYGNFENPYYYNIQTFKALDAKEKAIPAR